MKTTLKKVLALVTLVSILISMLSVAVFAVSYKDGYDCGQPHINGGQVLIVHANGTWEIMNTSDPAAALAVMGEGDTGYHIHTDSCYEQWGCAVCGLEEHTHTDEAGACYSDGLICGKHVHEESCYDAEHNLICGQQAGMDDCAIPEHTHTDACYSDHVHSVEAGCYSITCEAEGSYVCGLEHEHTEDCLHVHTEACYTLTCELGDKVLTCTETEHIHDEQCRTAHVHTEACYGRVLTCTETEHTHGNSCCKHVVSGLRSKHWIGACHTGVVTCGLQSATADMLHELSCLTSTELSPQMGKFTNIKVTAGSEPYVFKAPSSTYQYQQSGHRNRIYNQDTHIQTFMMIDTTNEGAVEAGSSWRWTADGKVYTPGTNNYYVAFCCDNKTNFNANIYYRQVNLEDSEYVNDEQAALVRSIVSSSFPFVTVEEMRANLVSDGVMTAEEAALLDEADLMAAGQLAIWAVANGIKAAPTVSDPYINDGLHVAGTISRTGSGAYMPMLTAHIPVNTSFHFYEPLQDRVHTVRDWLMGLTPTPVSSYEIIVSTVEVEELTFIPDGSGAYTAALNISLNAGCDADDEVTLTAVNLTSGDSVSTPVGSAVSYELELAANIGDQISVSISGVQKTEGGVYFFEPQATDANGDGVATTRESSQNLVGFSAGDIPVGDSVVLDTVDLLLRKVSDTGAVLTGAEFTLSYAGENGFEIGTYAVDENGEVTISGLIPGVTYELEETKVPEGYTGLLRPFTFRISGDGREVAQLSDLTRNVQVSKVGDQNVITVINDPPVIVVEEFTDLSVSKVWVGDGEENRPSEITVALLRDGEVYDTAVLSEAAGWSYKWTNLNEKYSWTVEELSVPEGYVSTVSYTGMDFTITNNFKGEEPPDVPDEDPPLDPGPTPSPTPTPTPEIPDIPDEEPPKDNVPKTGDLSALWLGMAALSGGGLTALRAFGRKRKGKDE